MNKGFYKGTLCNVPEIRTTQDGQTTITRFRLALNRRFKREGEPNADFISCVAFNKDAENIKKFFDKGSQILIMAHVRTGSYTNSEGNKVYTTDFVVDEWEFVGSKTEEPKKETEEHKSTAFVPVSDDDNLPWN